MEKSEAIEFCKVHYINYLGLAEGAMYTDYCAKVAVLLYSAFKANSRGSNTGRVFYACKKSGCFQDMEISRFRQPDCQDGTDSHSRHQPGKRQQLVRQGTSHGRPNRITLPDRAHRIPEFQL